METNYEKLLEQVKAGRPLPNGQLENILNQLRSRQFKGDPYTLIHILGQARYGRSLAIIKTYINYDSGNSGDDAMVRRIALQVAGRMLSDPSVFDLVEDRAFHDSSKYVRSVAATLIGFLGQCYHQFQSKSAYLLLKGIDEEREPYVLKSFYQGLLELLRVPNSEWPLPRQMVSKKEMRADLIQRAKELAKTTK